ncbi:MAG: hypothetical protein IBJ03_06510 [Gemmatimonadaceae bacterium]|nr:hypothetical protein [Gemmatimonadaceae bacterium]
MPATHASPWSLDEFATDVFFGGPEAAAEVTATPAVSLEAMEAGFAMRMAAERTRIEADAYARGRADGERAARASLDGTLATAMQAVREATDSIAVHEARWLSNAEENIAALSVIVAQHILQREIVADPSFVADLVTNAIVQYPIDQEITVRVNPEDFNACRRVIEQEFGSQRALRWISDVNVGRGGCLTEGRERIIDGRVDTALERAYRSLGGIQA